MLVLLWLHVAGIPLLGIAEGHGTLHSVSEGGIIALFAGVASAGARRRTATVAASLGLLTSSALIVHLTGGLIEAHFHFFVVVVVLTLYEDWLVFLLAVAYVGVHHGVAGALDPAVVYNHPAAMANPWRWAGIHALFIAGAGIGSIAAWRLNEEVRQRLAAVVEHSADAILEKDLDGRVLNWNRAAERLYGYSADEVRGKKLAILMPRELRSEYLQLLARVRRGEYVEDYETVRVRKDGRRVDVSLTISPIRDFRGRILGASTSARDITARKRAEVLERQAKQAAEQASRAKSEFLSRMSHEIRTPLNAILGFAQLLELDELDAAQRDGVGHILSGGRHLLDLINDVLQISRIEVGEMAISVEPVCIRTVVEDTVGLVRPLADARGVVLDIRLPADCDQVVLADYQRLKQVLLNLLSNGIKYNRTAGSLTVRAEERPEHRLALAVADTGAGIPADQLGKLFTPFERLGREDGAEEGTGLGLALSQGLIEAMGGELNVDSTPGHGTTFFVELPLGEAQDASPTEQLAAVPAVPPVPESEQQKRVLYIEDNPANLQLMEQLFLRLPETRLLTAVEGNLGLELAKRHRPDLILLDLNLPDMAGEDVLERLRGERATETVPVVVVSAAATDGQLSRLVAAGANDFVSKPIDVRRLLGAVDEQLNGALRHTLTGEAS